MNDYYDSYACDRKKQTHTHEFLGSIKIAEARTEAHNHRVAGVSGEAIMLGDGNHIHRVSANTDFYEDHFHMLEAKTGPGISVGEGKHVHLVSANTTRQDGHVHGTILATLIDNPIGN